MNVSFAAFLRSSLLPIALFFFSLMLFTSGLATQEVLGFDSRFYLFAEEMWRNGLSWFPTTYNQPYADYPATSTILIYWLAKAYGGLNKWVAVLPTAVAASLTVVFTYAIGAKRNTWWGIFAALFLLLTFAFIQSARAISLDLYTALFTTICFYLISTQPKRDTWIYFFLAAAFIFRGPIGLVIPTGVVCIYYLLNGLWRKTIITGLLAGLLLLACTLILLLLAYYEGGIDFLHAVLRMEVLGRIGASYLPRYFYLTEGTLNYALSLPIAFCVIISLCYTMIINRKLSADMRFLITLVGWIAVILLGMSIPGDKKIRYILPVAPAAALLAAYVFIAPSRELLLFSLRRFILGLVVILPLLFLGILIFLSYNGALNTLHINIAFTPIVIFLSAVQVANVGVFYCVKLVNVRTALLLFSAALVVNVLMLTVYEPIENALGKTREFVRRIEAERLLVHANLVFYRERSDNLPIKYLINMPVAETPVFIQQETALLHYPAPAFFITSQTYFDELAPDTKASFDVIVQNKIGHVSVIVFTQKSQK